jgi:hypothetical protein
MNKGKLFVYKTEKEDYKSSASLGNNHNQHKTIGKVVVHFAFFCYYPSLPRARHF